MRPASSVNPLGGKLIVSDAISTSRETKATLSFMSFRAFNFADVTGYLRGKRKESFIRCERSFIPMKLIQLAYLVIDLGNRVMKLYIETGLK